MKVFLSHGLRYGGTRPSRHADDANHSKIRRRVGSKEVCCRPRFRERIAGNALNEAVDITGTPKFRFLELAKSLDKEEGINPDDLIQKAEEIGIPNPRLQMNKMIRRGILYVHQGNVHVT